MKRPFHGQSVCVLGPVRCLAGLRPPADSPNDAWLRALSAVCSQVLTIGRHRGGIGFERLTGRVRYFSRPRSQMVRQRTFNPKIVGSIPTGGTGFAPGAGAVRRAVRRQREGVLHGHRHAVDRPPSGTRAGG